jgi:hypothetical protein
MRDFQQSGFLLILLVLIMGLTANRCTSGADPEILPVDESYKPDQLIEFSHDIHAGKNGIDCKFCHNAEFDEKNTGIPSMDVCMKCHKEVKGNPAQRSGK